MASNVTSLQNKKKRDRPAKTLQLSDEDLGRLIECIADGIIIHQDDHVVYANPSALAQFGVESLAELVGHKMLDLVAPDDRSKMRAFNDQLLTTGCSARRQKFRRQQLNGTLIEVETVSVRINWKGRPALLGVARNASQHEQTKVALAESEARLEGFLHTAAHWLWETDADHRFTFISESLSKSGFTQTQVLGKTRWELAGASLDNDAIWQEHVGDLNARRPFYDFEYQSITPNADELHRSISGIPVFDAHGAFQGYRGTSRDITERKIAERTIEHLALHDALTNLPNRTYFANELNRAFNTAKRNGARLAVLFLDLDHFKDINDTFGHSIGDKLLIEVANRLKSCLRDSDLVARFGGDEFVMIAPQPYDPISISNLADRIIKAIGEPYEIDRLTFHITISAGIAIYPDDGLDTEQILANADLALYTAKKAGRHTWRLFDHSLQQQLQARRSLDEELRHALDQNQFELHYQPLIDIADNRISSFEALIRWNHPKQGQRLPDTFIPATEQNRLIVPLTEWVLQEASTQLQRWASAGLDKRKIAVNISPILLKLQGFIRLFDRCMVPIGGDPENFVIEITEGMLDDEAKIVPILTALQERGVRIAIDDFGIGYSSMVRLKTLPIDVLKIDRSFLANVPEDASNASIVESLVNVGHSLGKKVVAEGVETVEQLSFLKSIGCDVAQGFFINRPMPAASITPWLEHRQLSERHHVKRPNLYRSTI